jgi:hypothetical protein
MTRPRSLRLLQSERRPPLPEFGQIAVGAGGFSERELEHLDRLREGAPFFSEERRAGSWFCRFGGYAGAIVLPGGRTLELLPKIASEGEVEARGLVMRMLGATGLVPALEADTAAYASSPHLLEAYLRLASVMAQQQLRRGWSMPTVGLSFGFRSSVGECG